MSIKVETIAVQPWRLSVGDFVALAKPRLNVLVVASAAVGYWLGAGGERQRPAHHDDSHRAGGRRRLGAESVART